MAGEIVWPSERKEGTIVKRPRITGKSRVVFQLKMNVNSVCIFPYNDIYSSRNTSSMEMLQSSLPTSKNRFQTKRYFHLLYMATNTRGKTNT